MGDTNTVPAEIVSTRKTFDGVTVHLHADGSVSDRLYFQRGKLPVATMWRVWGDIETYTHAELPEMIRASKRPTPRPVKLALPGVVLGGHYFRDLGPKARPRYVRWV